MMVNLVVVGIDGSENGARALRWAAELAAQTGGRLVVIHVFEPLAHLGEVQPPVDFAAMEAAAKRTLGEDWCAPCATLGVPYTTRVVEGDPAHALIAAAAEEHADLIVVGSRGLTGLRGVLVGSTSSKVLRHSDRPVAVIPPRHEPADAE
jgi:nucleotide-binding universal stress UspA family protein